jgi:hypothetical protein
MRQALRLGLGVLAVLSALVTVQAASASGSGGPEPVPLTGEVLITSEVGDPGTSQVSGTCNPFGESEFTFRVTGVAVGPYPGTFIEEGSFTLGPVGFPLVAFESAFTITSANGTVTGTKTLQGVTPTHNGACGEFVFGGTEAEAVDYQVPVRYTATITTTGGSATDSGDSFVSHADTQIRGMADFNGFSFGETFTSTAFTGDDGGDDDGDDGDDDGDEDGEGDDG